MQVSKSYSFLLERLKTLPVWGMQHFGDFIATELLRVIQLHPDKEDLVLSLFENSVTLANKLIQTKSRKLITYTQESHQKSNLMIWNDKLSSYKPGQTTKTLLTMLLKILVRELISKEKACKPFWTDAYKELSETLSLPIVIDCQDSGSISSRVLLKKPEGVLRSLKITNSKLQNKNLQKTYSVSSVSTAVKNWIKEHQVPKPKELMKTLTLTFLPTKEQKTVLDKQLQVSNYVYNKTVRYINETNSLKLSKLDLRDKFVTNKSRKDNVLFNKVNKAKISIETLIRNLKKERTLKSIVRVIMINKYYNAIKGWFVYLKQMIQPNINNLIKPFEIAIHKDIRAGSVFEAHTNFSNCVKAINSGRIKHFKLRYRTKQSKRYSMTLTKAMIKISNGTLRFTNNSLTDKTIHMANRTKKVLRNVKDLKDSKITKVNDIYQICIPVSISISTNDIDTSKIVGIDPGVSTFLSMYSPDCLTTIKQSSWCKYIDRLRSFIKTKRNERTRKRIRHRLMLKLDRKQANVINELHWKSINYLVKNYDIIFIEKFETQGFVKGGKSKTLNRDTNNHKPFQFRQRLNYKAMALGKIVSIVDAHYTTMTCSSCGNLKEMKLKDRVYECSNCKSVLDRDFNAGKNILLKGLLC